MILGGDYSPEQWPEEVWLEDARLMREAGVNLVSLGIFAWPRIEPEPGRFTFDWLDQIIDLLYAHGVSVNLATPTASPPPWLTHIHPEILPVTADGVTLSPGSRRHYCPHSPTYQAAASRIAREMAQHYRVHPALAMWHVDNEIACHVTECFCDESARAFRGWLQNRYATLDAFNKAWGTAFWGQHYNDWEEICPPRRVPTFINPSEQLDWLRFSSDSWLEWLKRQADILREETPGVPVITNFMGFFKPVDYWKMAALEDAVANDAYPDTSEPDWMVGSAMVCDLMRSLKRGEPWMLMEQATAHVNWRKRNPTKRPGVMRLGSYQAVARGADAIMFFQWRASPFGAEMHHSAMVPHNGTESRAWREVVQFGAEIRQLDGLLASSVHPEVAILFDWENWWALEIDGQASNDLNLPERVRALYEALYLQGIAVDFAHPEADLSGYKLVLAPILYLVTEAGVQNLTRFVEQGGVLLMTYFSGIVDACDHIRLGGYPAPFRNLLGMVVEEYVPFPNHGTNSVATTENDRFDCSLWADVIRVEGADVIARYTRDFYAGRPAITRHQSGDGAAFYAGTELDGAGMAWMLETLCKEAGVAKSTPMPAGVERVERTNGDESWVFLLNYSDSDVYVPLDQPGRDLLTGASVGGSIRLGPMGAAIVHTTRAGSLTLGG